MIDSHTHLHLCKGDEADLLGELTRALTVGTDLASCREAIAAAGRHPGRVWAAVGQHPTAADELAPDQLQELARDPRVLAIGETGLDYFHDRAPRPAQHEAFVKQLELARMTAKPVVIHSREAEQDTLDVLADHATGVEVLMHCFSMPARLDECLERGYWISFAGNVTYDERLAQAAARTPADRLLVETDAPYLTPKPHRGERNRPAFVSHTARFIAEQRGVPYAELESQVEQNAARLLGW